MKEVVESQEQKADRYFDLMLSRASLLSSGIKGFSLTKGSSDSGADYLDMYYSMPSFDVPDWLSDFIDEYADSDDLDSWDEYSALQRLASDSDMTDAQINAIIQALAIGYTSRYGAIEEEEECCAQRNNPRYNVAEQACFKRYRRQVSKVIVMYTLAGGVAAYLVQPEAVMIAATTALFAIDDAKIALEDCLDQADKEVKEDREDYYI